MNRFASLIMAPLFSAFLFFLLLGCSSSSTPKADGPGISDATGLSDGAAEAGTVLCGGSVCPAGSVCCGPSECGFCIPENSGAYCPPTCPDAGIASCAGTPTGFCDPSGAEPCQDGVATCRCVGVCSGPEPPPGEEYEWVCLLPLDPRCPSSVPQNGDDCRVEGLSCRYSSCGDDATCTDGKWNVIGPPP